MTRPAEGQPIDEKSWAWPLVIALAALASTSYLVRLSPVDLAIRGLITDDAYFYGIVARNYLEHGFWTFDGVHPTNGVQPLWQWITVALHSLLPESDVMFVMFAASWLLYGAFAFLATRYLLRILPGTNALEFLAFSALITLSPRFQSMVLRGLETPLILVAVSIHLHLLASIFDDRRNVTARRAVVLGVSCAIVFFCRTDWLIFTLGAQCAILARGAAASSSSAPAWPALSRAIAAARGATTPRPPGSSSMLHDLKLTLMPMLVSGIATSALVLPYLIHNVRVHGHVMPISGRVKLFYLEQYLPTWIDYLASDEWRGLLDAIRYAFLLPYFLLGLIPIVLAAKWLVREFKSLKPSFQLLALICLAHILFMQFVYLEVRPYTRYYFNTEVLLVGLVAAAALAQARGSLKRRLGRRYRLAPAALIVAIFLAHLGAGYARTPSTRWLTRMEIAEAARELPSDARVGAFWPGMFAYYSERDVTPLDGIISSSRYLEEVVKPGTQIEYMQENGIQYLMLYIKDPEIFNRNSPPRIPDWSYDGTVKLWQRRDRIERIAAVREMNDKGEGWYLFELKPGSESR